MGGMMMRESLEIERKGFNIKFCMKYVNFLGFPGEFSPFLCSGKSTVFPGSISLAQSFSPAFW